METFKEIKDKVAKAHNYRDFDDVIMKRDEIYVMEEVAARWAEREVIAFHQWRDRHGWKHDHSEQHTHTIPELYKLYKNESH